MDMSLTFVTATRCAVHWMCVTYIVHQLPVLYVPRFLGICAFYRKRCAFQRSLESPPFYRMAGFLQKAQSTESACDLRFLANASSAACRALARYFAQVVARAAYSCMHYVHCFAVCTAIRRLRFESAQRKERRTYSGSWQCTARGITLLPQKSIASQSGVLMKCTESEKSIGKKTEQSLWRSNGNIHYVLAVNNIE